MDSTLVRQLGARIAVLPLLLVIIAAITFVMVRIAPGDPASLLLGSNATAESIASLRAELGLDRPMLVQFADYLGGLVQGDLGNSYRTDRPVLPDLLAAAGTSAILAGTALALSAVIGIAIGVLSAVRQGSLIDGVSRVMVLGGVSLPVYWLGLVLIAFFSVRLGLLPASGWGSVQHMILPVMTLATYPLAVITRMTRSSMLGVLREDYLRTARANGISEMQVVGSHALRNALVPVVTILGIQLGSLFGSSVLTETVFAIPGLGRATVQAILARDYPVVGGAVLLGTFVFVLVNLITDVLYLKLNPRITSL